METKPGKLILENGEAFKGKFPIWQKEPVFGEVVFTTGMTGYIETLTDPSFTDQIITFTYPLIGNYGVPDQSTWESKKIYAAGVIVSELAPHYCHFAAKQSLIQWLEKENVPILFGVDTRAITKSLRTRGVIPGALTTGETPKEFIDPNKTNLLKKASANQIETFGEGDKTIIAIDCGMKENILRHLKKLPAVIKKVPYDYDFTDEPFDGIFISNGPGDPKMCNTTVEILKKALRKEKPVFGICLGTQLLALAIGANTYKLPYGHRGQNQPCFDMKTKQCYLTAQNHGFAIDPKSLPEDWQVRFRNLNDETIEGIEHKSLPFFAVQFHPEAAPGPMDTSWLFDTFYSLL